MEPKLFESCIWSFNFILRGIYVENSYLFSFFLCSMYKQQYSKSIWILAVFKVFHTKNAMLDEFRWCLQNHKRKVWKTWKNLPSVIIPKSFHFWNFPDRTAVLFKNFTGVKIRKADSCSRNAYVIFIVSYTLYGWKL